MNRTARAHRAVRHVAHIRAQAAYRRFLDHSRICPIRAVDSSVCATASALWTAYREAHAE